ncbi:hypothetical protein EJ08DRAFT_683531 [Tothia fuscella]|uniref:Aminoglycoside phosphotransferase domain-containing protein n=1 Tax=Tothia fuscella TaxID=1048955 RepID=A0A9P4TTI4_9PEZI|nr:hypothetical protein EJ08DRAFT_683531 [Tothia fuscella]
MEVLPHDAHRFVRSAMDHTGRPSLQSTSPASPNSPEFYSFQKLLRDIYQSSTISLQRVDRLKRHVHMVYTLRTADNSVFTLKCQPSRNTHLLRHEQKSLETEARVIDLIKSSSRLPVPQRISFDVHTINSIGAPYLLRSYLPGTPLSSLPLYLSPAELSSIDRALGSYFFSFTQIRKNTFGLVDRVHAGTGHQTWSEAFLSLLEMVLRDGEDALVSLPYDSIRYHVARHKSLLDQIMVPSLVPLEAGGPRNVLIDERSRQVVGLLGFSTAVWGDPMLAGVFAGASESFWEGYGERPVNDRPHCIRGLLYCLYRAAVGVVTQYYRPGQGDEENEARRSLVWVVNKLNTV